jgi:DNA-binding HxlR family transcriptional regulator
MRSPAPIDPAPMRRGDLFSAACPSRSVLQHVTSRWGVLVLVALLGGGTVRFSDLRRRIGGVSERMLAQTLDRLGSDGFVVRTEHPVQPPHVDYALSPLGHEAARHVHELFDWIEGRMPAIQQARARQGEASGAPAPQARVRPKKRIVRS